MKMLMGQARLLVLLLWVGIQSSSFAQAQYVYEEEMLYDSFPDGFVWGIGTSAYQIEGAWNVDGKGVSIWDTFTEEPGNIVDGSDGKVACDSYNKYGEDVQLVQDMGLTHYRFSIAWTRILPEGTGEVNQAGIDYYNNLIDELIAKDIVPVITLYHWDLPQALEDLEGWRNDLIPVWFEEYARVCFEAFGDRVKIWFTLNEPYETSIDGHGTGVMAPGYTEIGTMVYTVTHNLIKAHAKAYRAYDQDFKPTQNGRVGITLNVNWMEPEDPDDSSHHEASDTKLEFDFGWYAHPILIDGTYPDVMREKIDAKSEAQGYTESRLPTFTEEESAEIAGSFDFLGVNHYTTNLVYPEEGDIAVVSFFEDDDVVNYLDESWYPSGSSWLRVAPFGVRKLLNWINDNYDPGEIMITENGFSDQQGNLDDIQRIYYYKHYLNQILRAIVEDDINVTGYFAWSLMDNFEWARGYTEKFGVHSVDFSDSSLPRTVKESARFLSDLAGANAFVESSGPCSNDGAGGAAAAKTDENKET